MHEVVSVYLLSADVSVQFVLAEEVGSACGTFLFSADENVNV